MKKINILIWLLILMAPSMARSQEEALSQEAAQSLFLDMAKVFLTRFDRVCLSARLDNIPLQSIMLQHDLLQQETAVLRSDSRQSGPQGYSIKLRSIAATVEELPKQTENEVPRMRSLSLWSVPVFSSQFKIGDFIPSLLLQMRFVQKPNETIDGRLQHVMMGLLPIGDGSKYQKLFIYIDVLQNLPTGFDFYNGNGELSRSIRISEFGTYGDKQYAKIIEASNRETGQKSYLEIVNIVPIKQVPAFDLSAIDQTNWQNYCPNS